MTKLFNGLKKLWNFFTTYEKCWYLSILGLTVLFIVFLPDLMLEDDIGGNLFLVICSITAIIGSVTCELLLSKQCKWNFVVSLVTIELTEMVIFFSLGYYASALVSLIFWVPVDILSFINWNKNKDKQDTKLTKVKSFTLKQDLILVLIIAVYTVTIGYLLTLIGGEDTYFDALVSALGMTNGLLILFRFREQWVVWLIYTFAEATLWILSGHYIMLLMTAGFLTNTIYGFIKWTIYIRTHKNEKLEQIKAIPTSDAV